MWRNISNFILCTTCGIYSWIGTRFGPDKLFPHLGGEKMGERVIFQQNSGTKEWNIFYWHMESESVQWWMLVRPSAALVKNLNGTLFLETIKVSLVKLCVMITYFELYASDNFQWPWPNVRVTGVWKLVQFLSNCVKNVYGYVNMCMDKIMHNMLFINFMCM